MFLLILRPHPQIIQDHFDKFGNIVNNIGQIVFKVTELDSEGEIPAEFVFEKHKENLMEMGAVALSDPELKVEEYAMVPQTLPVPQKTPAKDTDEDEDELVERELQQFK